MLAGLLGGRWSAEGTVGDPSDEPPSMGRGVLYFELEFMCWLGRILTTGKAWKEPSLRGYSTVQGLTRVEIATCSRSLCKIVVCVNIP